MIRLAACLPVGDPSRRILLAFQTRPAVSPQLHNRLRRLLRLSPDTLALFDAYDVAYQGSLTKELLEDWAVDFRKAVQGSARTIRRVVPDAQQDELQAAITDFFSEASPYVRRLGAKPPSGVAYTALSRRMWPLLAMILRSLGIEPVAVPLPGPVRFLGLKGGGEVEDPVPAVPPAIANAFSPEEESLPRSAEQPSADLDEMYAQASVAFEHQLDLLNRGSGLDRAIGASVVDRGKGDRPDYTEPGPIVVIGRMKNRGRVLEKAATDNMPVSSVLDLVRATVVVDRAEDISDVMRYLRAAGIRVARRPKNRFSSPTEVNYRDLMFNIRYPNGHIGELQVNLRPMLQAKEVGHAFYESVREIVARVKAENRSMTVEEQATIDEANERQRELYDNAWRKAMGALLSRVAALKPLKETSGLEYYEYDDFPTLVDRRNRRLPVKIVVANKKVQVDDLERFYREATRISSARFKSMVRNNAR